MNQDDFKQNLATHFLNLDFLEGLIRHQGMDYTLTVAAGLEIDVAEKLLRAVKLIQSGSAKRGVEQIAHVLALMLAGKSNLGKEVAIEVLVQDQRRDVYQEAVRICRKSARVEVSPKTNSTKQKDKDDNNKNE